MTDITENIEKDEKDLLESEDDSKPEVHVEKHEKVPNEIIQKYTRPPAFQKSFSTWRWNTQPSNNRQRPGRAAWRWR